MPEKKDKSVPETPKNQSLALGSKEKQELSKAQKTFNRLVKKIEKLQQQIETDGAVLDEKLQFYARHLHPLEKEETALRKTLLKQFYPFYLQDKGLSKPEKAQLRNIMVSFFYAVTETGPPDEELEQIFEALEGKTLKDVEQEKADQIKDQMASMFEALGFDLDLRDLDLNMDPEALEKKLAEMQADFMAQAEAMNRQKTVRKKTKKVLEKEAREKAAAELKSKSIGSIYKQLAKIFHPDLEPDPEQRNRKEMLMKELTGAYKKNDLHTLLRLELEWINSGEANVEKLTDDKLGIFNEVLKEQAARLEQDVYSLSQHPKYGPLRRFARFASSLKFVNLKLEKNDLAEKNKALQQIHTLLQGENALSELKELLRMHRA